MKSRTEKPNNKFKRFAALLAGLVLALGAVFLTVLALTPDPFPRNEYRPSVRIEDRNGYLLTEFLSDSQTISQWVRLEEMSPWLIKAAVAAEDKRFYSHPGLDILALFRAVVQNLKAGRVTSGASTITMQLVRILEPGPRTLAQKTIEAFKALRLELSHPKKEILEQYLNRVPCGNLVHGIPAAARLYLDKSAATLSPAEAAFLTALPQAPSAMNPYHRRDRALSRRSLIIGRMENLGFLNREEAQRARIEPLVLAFLARNFSAPHFVTHVRAHLPSPVPETLRTTLNLDLQTKIEQLVQRVIGQGKNKDIHQAAVLVMDHRTREILAWVGSADFFDPHEGQNDGVKALRQPGSAVKPFTYAAAFDYGLTPATMIDDSPVDYGLDRGVYSPSNYDERFHGLVCLRVALASSLNVPAVKLLDRVGLPRVHSLMKQAGLVSLNREPDYYGLGLTLGCGDISLLDLANGYATLASGGKYCPPVFIREPKTTNRPDGEQSQQVFSPQAAYLVTHILSDDAARVIGFGRDSLLALPFPAAAKTGTSKNFRDNWTVGYTSKVVVAVWAGNFDARPMGRVSGISGAGPLWRQVMRLAAEYYPPTEFTRPKGLVQLPVCPESGMRATPHCPNQRTEIFMENHLPPGYCLRHLPLTAKESETPAQPKGLAILSPRDGERYLFDPGIEEKFQNLFLSAQAAPGVDTLIWYVNGREIGRQKAEDQKPRDIFWPLRRGLITIELRGQSQGQPAASDRVVITVH